MTVGQRGLVETYLLTVVQTDRHLLVPLQLQEGDAQRALVGARVRADSGELGEGQDGAVGPLAVVVRRQDVCCFLLENNQRHHREGQEPSRHHTRVQNSCSVLTQAAVMLEIIFHIAHILLPTICTPLCLQLLVASSSLVCF